MSRYPGPQCVWCGQRVTRMLPDDAPTFCNLCGHQLETGHDYCSCSRCELQRNITFLPGVPVPPLVLDVPDVPDLTGPLLALDVPDMSELSAPPLVLDVPDVPDLTGPLLALDVPDVPGLAGMPDTSGTSAHPLTTINHGIGITGRGFPEPLCTVSFQGSDMVLRIDDRRNSESWVELRIPSEIIAIAADMLLYPAPFEGVEDDDDDEDRDDEDRDE